MAKNQKAFENKPQSKGKNVQEVFKTNGKYIRIGFLSNDFNN
jgi:hypothetical protein